MIKCIWLYKVLKEIWKLFPSPHKTKIKHLQNNRNALRKLGDVISSFSLSRPFCFDN